MLPTLRPNKSRLLAYDLVSRGKPAPDVSECLHLQEPTAFWGLLTEKNGHLSYTSVKTPRHARGNPLPREGQRRRWSGHKTGNDV